MWERQGLHAALVALLALGVLALGGRGAAEGSLWGLDTSYWLWVSVLFTVMHQGYVAFTWRLELHRHYLTEHFGKQAFGLYLAGFLELASWRVLLLFAVAASNRGVWHLPTAVTIGVTMLLVAPFVALVRSVVHDLGWRRALGSDHFTPVRLTLVKEGLFGLIENPIYTLGPLAFYLPGLWFGSPAALLAAAFQHAALWAHWYCTEVPDMARLYGGE